MLYVNQSTVVWLHFETSYYMKIKKEERRWSQQEEEEEEYEFNRWQSTMLHSSDLRKTDRNVDVVTWCQKPAQQQQTDNGDDDGDDDDDDDDDDILMWVVVVDSTISNAP